MCYWKPLVTLKLIPYVAFLKISFWVSYHGWAQDALTYFSMLKSANKE
jgi:hypothetical protein